MTCGCSLRSQSRGSGIEHALKANKHRAKSPLKSAEKRVKHSPALSQPLDLASQTLENCTALTPATNSLASKTSARDFLCNQKDTFTYANQDAYFDYRDIAPRYDLFHLSQFDTNQNFVYTADFSSLNQPMEFPSSDLSLSPDVSISQGPIEVILYDNRPADFLAIRETPGT